ncbi:MAG: hypothetical protein AB1414_10635, partial [bacterium]
SAERYLITSYQSPVTRIKFRALFVQHDTNFLWTLIQALIILSLNSSFLHFSIFSLSPYFYPP